MFQPKASVRRSCPMESLAQGGGGCGIMNGHGTNLIHGKDKSGDFLHCRRSVVKPVSTRCSSSPGRVGVPIPEEEKRSKLFSQ
ncbi:hypothetical protein GWL_22570 [Herbaspirillum sp. GW103]|nr:hypothetical protein GWL_22570 [Herbaspirillum sp. GW103]